MLVIGDIHITTKVKDSICDEVALYVQAHSDEKSIVFVGDYVYHFNYERKALLQFFSLLLGFVEQGKNVYVLAGNHDRLGGYFVYEEAARTTRMLQSNNKEGGAIKFITEPECLLVDGHDVLFFPYYLPEIDARSGHPERDELVASSHPKENISGRANNVLKRHVEQWRNGQQNSETLLLVHHWYIANTVFPGQQARFSYKSPALSSERLDQSDLRLLSGHLHQPFCFKNYFCCGSVRHTSPLEINQHKFLYKISLQSGTILPHYIEINPYLVLSEAEEGRFDEEKIQSALSEIWTTNLSLLQGDSWSVDPAYASFPVFDISSWRITIKTVKGYDQMSELIDESVLNTIKECTLKQPQASLHEIVTQLEHSSGELESRISSWKFLLQEYIEKKYGESAQLYKDDLERLGIVL